MREVINKSGPPGFPIPNASIFTTIINWLGLAFYSSRSVYICFTRPDRFTTIWSPCPEPGKIPIAFSKA